VVRIGENVGLAGRITDDGSAIGSTAIGENVAVAPRPASPARCWFW